MEQIIKYFPNLDQQQLDKFARLEELYNYWNEKINVVSRKDIEHLYTHHVLHSLAIAKLVDFKPNTQIFDVGTGGGFPGIPLAIMFPEVNFFLIDSTAKKIKVVDEVKNSLDLKNVTSQAVRSDSIKTKFDFILGRAITNFPKFLASVNKNIKKEGFNDIQNGIIYLKGGDFDEEIKNFRKKIKIHEISDFFDNPFFETKKIVYYRNKEF